MNTLSHTRVLYLFCAWIAGCAVPEPSHVTSDTATSVVTNTLSTDTARNAITIGKSTKADVVAALGKTVAIGFDSGYEVWVYHVKSDATPAQEGWRERMGLAGAKKETPVTSELVVLFAPSGVVTKARIRTAPPQSETKAK